MNSKKFSSRIAVILFISSCLASYVPSVFAQQVVSSSPTLNKVVDSLLIGGPLTKAQFDKLPPAQQQQYIIALSHPSSGRGSVSASTAGSVNCFDYYHFGSVQVNIAPNYANTIVPGEPMTFVGTMKNSNDYPVIDGQMYVKIFYKNQKDDSLTHQNGYQLVDQFVALDNVTLNAKENKSVSFYWNVPKYAESGDYTIATYFTSAHRYNLLGLTFTDDVTGSKSDFSIKNNTTPQVVYFDKNSVKLNGTLFRFAAFPPHFKKDDVVTTYATVINPSSKATSVEVTWKAYTWDGMLESHLKATKTETITLQPHEKKSISYEVPFINSSVSYVVAGIKDRDTKSLLDIRFVRDDIEETRINFPAVTKYPLVAGQESTLFSCVHSTNLPVVKDNKLTLTLRDNNDTILHTYTYSGDVTGEMMGVKDSFVPKKNISTFSLTAKLERGGQTVEEVKMLYDCNAIDNSLCEKVATSTDHTSLLGSVGSFVKGLFTNSTGGEDTTGTNSTSISGTGAGIAVVVLLVLATGGSWFFFKRKRDVGSAIIK